MEQSRFPHIESEVGKFHLHNSNGPDLYLEGRILVQASGWALPGLWRIIQVFEAGHLLVAMSQISKTNPRDKNTGVDASIRIAEDLDEVSAFLGFDLLSKQVLRVLGVDVSLTLDDLYHYQQMEDASSDLDFMPGTGVMH